MYVLRNSLQSSLNEFLGFYFKRYYFIVFPVTILIELLVWWLYSCTLVRNKHKMHQKTYLLVQFLSKKRLVCLHLTHLQPFSEVPTNIYMDRIQDSYHETGSCAWEIRFICSYVITGQLIYKEYDQSLNSISVSNLTIDL